MRKAEHKRYSPPREFVAGAAIPSAKQYRELYNESINNPSRFWRVLANQLDWLRPFEKVLTWRSPNAKWFVGGYLNVCDNCVDRHAHSDIRNKAAIIWEGEDGTQRILTYNELYFQVQQFANVLKNNGVKKSDRVMIYMPMVPEAAIAMLACARIGAVHSVVFGGFSAQAIAERIKDCKAKIIITADGGYRRGKIIELKKNIDEALRSCKGVKRVVVLKRTNQKIKLSKIDRWWHEEMSRASRECKPEKLNSEHPLFILYTSGSTGKPKGILHSTAGYLLGAHATVKYVFDIKPSDIYWCTADVGWITGHTYTVYGALSNGATTFIYEGAPDYPKPDRFWGIIEKYGITVFYTAPTVIRSFIKMGDAWVKKHNLSSLRLLGTVGEPINPDVWRWYHQTIGHGRCPIVDTWWQTETGSNAITTLPGAHNMKPGSAGLPFFGIDADVVDKHGKPVKKGENGYLVIKKSWPSMLRGIYGDSKRYKKQYWSDFKGWYFSGDGAKIDRDGYIWITGRVDDVLNVSGHRLGTAEVESALIESGKVSEAAVIGVPDEIKGEMPVAFVTLKQQEHASVKLKESLILCVAQKIGSFAKPRDIRFVRKLPTTRSGKIMRRLLREIATTKSVRGDITTLEDISVVTDIAKGK